jgi:hypothetical protein
VAACEFIITTLQRISVALCLLTSMATLPAVLRQCHLREIRQQASVTIAVCCAMDLSRIILL